MFAAILTLECVKCTGKFRPINSPFFFDSYNKFSFEAKKKVEGQFFNIIDTNTMEKLVKLQKIIFNAGSGSLMTGHKACSFLTYFTPAQSPKKLGLCSVGYKALTSLKKWTLLC